MAGAQQLTAPPGTQPLPQQAAGPPAPAQAAPVQPQPPMQLPAAFQLNPLQQTQLDVVLNKWQQESAKINTFRCPFERWEYNKAFGPDPDMKLPLYKNQGELSFAQPDQGSFRITKVTKWQDTPVPAGQAPPAVREGNWVPDPKAVGEHWVCDGKNVYEYRHDQKQLVVRPIPPQLQGKAIVDGPLPFLFGADVAKLNARYWMRVDEAFGQANPADILIEALPKFQADAANYSKVQVILDKASMLPKAMQVHMPNQDRNVYIFDLANAKKNNLFQQLKGLFAAPELLPGWKRVVEEMPMEQAARPQPPAR
jgi:TIGR03009 family protein